MEDSLLKIINEKRGNIPLSRFIAYGMEELICGESNLCNIELAAAKERIKELENIIAKTSSRRPRMINDFKLLEGTAKRRFIELLTEDTEAARTFKPPRKGGSGFSRWQDRARFMVEKYADQCGLSLQPHEWISLIEKNPALRTGQEQPEEEVKPIKQPDRWITPPATIYGQPHCKDITRMGAVEGG